MAFVSRCGLEIDLGSVNDVLPALFSEEAGVLLQVRTDARRDGRLYGFGCAAVVEPSMSNMGYITTVLTREERERSGPKNGASTIVSIALDPLGSVNVTIDSVPQGQGHRTAVAQVVGEVLGVPPQEIVVESSFDSHVTGWSIAAGNYSSRFGPAVAGAVYLAAGRIRTKLARIAKKSTAYNGQAARLRGFAFGLNPGTTP